MLVTAYIGIGANLGDASATVLQAIARLAQLEQVRLSAQSSLFQSSPVDAGGDDYVNAVIEIGTDLSAEELLQALQELELAFGRERSYRNAPRTLDLDLLLYGNQQIHSEHLSVPHPRMTERAFVLLPLLQIAPSAQIPGKGNAQQFVSLVATQAIRRLD